MNLALPVPEAVSSPCSRWLATLATDVDAAIGATLWLGELAESDRDDVANALDAVADEAGIPRNHRHLLAINRWVAASDGDALIFTRGDVTHRTVFAEDGTLVASSAQPRAGGALTPVPFAVAQDRLARGILAARRQGGVTQHSALMPLLAGDCR
jgi:hypothetical protein